MCKYVAKVFCPPGYWCELMPGVIVRDKEVVHEEETAGDAWTVKASSPFALVVYPVVGGSANNGILVHAIREQVKAGG